MQAPKNSSGTRDFNLEQVQKRKYIFSHIQSVFEKYGFFPIETPAIENVSVLEGKYGEEGDKLLMRIRSNRKLYDKYPELKGKIESVYSNPLYMESDKALRYDLTVPFARFVTMNSNRIVFPFKRYQMQPVWRGDRPQKGRYCEFYQCDVDVIGSDSLLSEAEFVMIYNEIFRGLGIHTHQIKINHRKILEGLVYSFSLSAEQKKDFIIALDKYDKIGEQGVMEEWTKRNINLSGQNPFDLFRSLDECKSLSEKIECLKEKVKMNESLEQGIQEIETVVRYLEVCEFDFSALKFDLTLSRGLDYYTGTIFEVQIEGAQVGSVGGGGRYDNLTDIFGLKGVSGVGVSVGAERLYDVMEEKNLFPENLSFSPKVMIAHFGEEYLSSALQLLQQLRENNISAEMYHKPAAFSKQFKYADAKSIPYVAMIGEDEVKENCVTLKNMLSGEQKKIKYNQVIESLT